MASSSSSSTAVDGGGTTVDLRAPQLPDTVSGEQPAGVDEALHNNPFWARYLGTRPLRSLHPVAKVLCVMAHRLRRLLEGHPACVGPLYAGHHALLLRSFRFFAAMGVLLQEIMEWMTEEKELESRLPAFHRDDVFAAHARTEELLHTLPAAQAAGEKVLEEWQTRVIDTAQRCSQLCATMKTSFVLNQHRLQTWYSKMKPSEWSQYKLFLRVMCKELEALADGDLLSHLASVALTPSYTEEDAAENAISEDQASEDSSGNLGSDSAASATLDLQAVFDAWSAEEESGFQRKLFGFAKEGLEHTNEILSKRLEPTYKLLVEQARKVNQKGVDIPTLKRVHTKRLATLEPELAEWEDVATAISTEVAQVAKELLKTLHPNSRAWKLHGIRMTSSRKIYQEFESLEAQMVQALIASRSSHASLQHVAAVRDILSKLPYRDVGWEVLENTSTRHGSHVNLARLKSGNETVSVVSFDTVDDFLLAAWTFYHWKDGQQYGPIAYSLNARNMPVFMYPEGFTRSFGMNLCKSLLQMVISLNQSLNASLNNFNPESVLWTSNTSPRLLDVSCLSCAAESFPFKREITLSEQQKSSVFCPPERRCMEGGGPSLSEEESTLAFPERDLWAVFVLVYVGLKFDSLCLLLDPIPHSSISQEIERLCCPETSHRTVEEFCRGVSPGKIEALVGILSEVFLASEEQRRQLVTSDSSDLFQRFSAVADYWHMADPNPPNVSSNVHEIEEVALFLSEVRKWQNSGARGSLNIHVDRERLLLTFFRCLYYSSSSPHWDNMVLYQPRTHVTDETGQDAGGVTTNILIEMWDTVGGHPFMEAPTGQFALPSPGGAEDREVMEHELRGVGFMIFKTFFEDRVIPQNALSSFLWRFLCDDLAIPTAAELQEHDPALMRSLDMMMLSNGVENWGLCFSDAGGPPLAVTDENKAVYFSQKVFHEMVGKRLPGLLAIREGFFKPIRALDEKESEGIQPLESAIRKLSSSQLKSMITGESHMSAATLQGWVSCEEKQSLNLLVDTFCWWEEHNPEMLSRLLQFITGMPSVPVTSEGEQRLYFYVQTEDRFDRFLPRAHLCFNSVDLWGGYETAEDLRRDLETAIEYSGSGSGVWDD